MILLSRVPRTCYPYTLPSALHLPPSSKLPSSLARYSNSGCWAVVWRPWAAACVLLLNPSPSHGHVLPPCTLAPLAGTPRHPAGDTHRPCHRSTVRSPSVGHLFPGSHGRGEPLPAPLVVKSGMTAARSCPGPPPPLYGDPPKALERMRNETDTQSRATKRDGRAQLRFLELLGFDAPLDSPGLGTGQCKWVRTDSLPLAAGGGGHIQPRRSFPVIQSSVFAVAQPPCTWVTPRVWLGFTLGCGSA